jgi:pyruvate dehydrogenase E2 component (dihydrolipoamide acetyltransferase)
VIEVRLPQLGMGMKEGTILRWYKKAGDAVQANEPLAEVEAEKSVFELVAPQSGVIAKIIVDADTTVPTLELLALLTPLSADSANDSAGETVKASPAEHYAESKVQSASTPTPEKTDSTPRASGDVRNVEPRARKLAAEAGINLAGVVGTGSGGRITEADVRSFLDKQRSSSESGDIKLRGIRGTIARRMHESLQSMAQLTLTTSVDVTRLVDLRSKLAPQERFSYVSAIAWVAARALRQHPRLNATLDGNIIKTRAQVNIGIATAVPDGLIVPVIVDADKKTLAQIEHEAQRQFERVRTNQFSPEEVEGSTFTVSSLGAHGIDAFTPIINPPEAAILGIGRIVDQPVRQGDGIAWRKMMTLSLTIDHRIIDGVPGAEFLQSVAKLLDSLPFD